MDKGVDEMESNRPIFLYRLFQAAAIIGAIPFLINTIDVLLNPLSSSIDPSFSGRLVTGLVVAPLTVVIGILCVRRVPDNMIGWMLVSFGYGASTLVTRFDLLPLATLLIITNLTVNFFWYAYLLIPLYFPTGELFPPRLNRWGNRIIGVLFPVIFLSVFMFNRELTYGTVGNEVGVDNPFFLIEFDYSVITVPLINAIIILGLITLFLRYRRGNAIERSQIRWLFVGVLLQFGLVFAQGWIASILGVGANQLIGSIYTIVVPFTIGIAILRHRLYDIDIIIRRTLIYSVLSGLLALVFFGGVTLTQALFRSATGEGSDLAIVVSTLAIAALFSPLRRRVQNAIDRRFYRRKYNAEKTLEQFAALARDEVDVEKLKAALVSAVQETMQPKGVGIWMRESKKAADTRIRE
jgi:hypothetical protein